MCSFEGTFNAFNGPVAQLVRAPPCHGGGHGFESRLGRNMHGFEESAHGDVSEALAKEMLGSML